MVDAVRSQQFERLANVVGGTLLTGVNTGLEALPAQFTEVGHELLRRIAELWPAHAETGDPVGPGRNAVKQGERVVLTAVAVGAHQETGADAGPTARVGDRVQDASRNSGSRQPSRWTWSSAFGRSRQN